MKHAGPTALDQLKDLLAAVRETGGLAEKSPGVFHHRSRAFLHFHEDPAGLFADIRAPDESGFDRIKLDEAVGRAELLARLRAAD